MDPGLPGVVLRETIEYGVSIVDVAGAVRENVVSAVERTRPPSAATRRQGGEPAREGPAMAATGSPVWPMPAPHGLADIPAEALLRAVRHRARQVN